jgi:cytochrome c biogenesis protein|uniref:Cytochrome c biogenesis protein Ccs1 n=1 Tax=Thalassiosira weissflogii TaxID=1577725 RepID=A0A089VIV9_THAWE|nr:c-type cytochrome biogenesis protein [Conticribra weissflogii]YP_009093538.1 c-type cytochrome biogenesis protein [Conticribra weissflogii]AIR76163.1 c-type cytochrome biogenesis protein [Conticribra weissflogii]AIR76211.1 c-type cytochrome biogenesis protein [Conticribra weissflogii]
MKQNIFKSIADLRFAILILLVIAAFSVIGTVIEQDQSIETYKLNYPLTNRVFGFLSWDIILRFGLDHIYKTWWFISLILLFGISLLTCTLLQQFPALKIARRCQFFRTTQQFCRLNISTNLQHLSFSQLLFKIKENKYSIFQQKNIIYCYKGLIGRIAPIIVHFSMILVLIGAIIGSISGFKAQEIVPKTETFHIQNVLTNGQFTFIPKVSVRVNDFWITYTKQTTIAQFYSDLSILNGDGNEIERKTIFVNSPAKYNGVDYYQTDWNLIGLRMKNKDLVVYQYPLINLPTTSEKIWLTWISNNQQLDDGFTILINNLQGYCSVYNKVGEFIGNLELNESLKTSNSITLMDILSSTGLQIKADPGIALIYLGFLFLMISTLISYITYSQIWIVQDKKKIFIGGTTTRATFDFELEFLKLVK